MKIDLEDLERKASAATPGPWTSDATDIVHDLGPGSAFVERIGMANARKNVDHIAANSPPVTLALVARIRELEAAHRDLGDAFQMLADAYEPDVPLHRGRIDGLVKLLRKGAALP